MQQGLEHATVMTSMRSGQVFVIASMTSHQMLASQLLVPSCILLAQMKQRNLQLLSSATLCWLHCTSIFTLCAENPELNDLEGSMSAGSH